MYPRGTEERAGAGGLRPSPTPQGPPPPPPSLGHGQPQALLGRVAGSSGSCASSARSAAAPPRATDGHAGLNAPACCLRWMSPALGAGCSPAGAPDSEGLQAAVGSTHVLLTLLQRFPPKDKLQVKIPCDPRKPDALVI